MYYLLSNLLHLTALCVCVCVCSSVSRQVRAVMRSGDVTFTAASSATSSGSSALCNDEAHTVTWSISRNTLALKVDVNDQENFPFNQFRPCPDLDVPLYLGGVKGQSSFRVIVNHYGAS